MSITIKFTQQRPSLDVHFYNATEDFKNLKLKLSNENKLIDKGFIMLKNNLIKEWTLVFPTLEDYDNFDNNPIVLNFALKVREYNNENKISFYKTVNDTLTI
jgi:hypothetical protein